MILDTRPKGGHVVSACTRHPHFPEQLPDATFTLDAEGRFTSANHTLECAAGCTRDVLLGRLLTDTLRVEEPDEVRRLVGGTMRGTSQHAELRYRGADEAPHVAWVQTSPIVERERVIGVMGVLHEVTNEASRAEQVLQCEKLATLGQLASGVAHELNNPLAGIMALSQILLASPADGAEQRDALATIHKEAQRAARIVSNLLAFARQHAPERTEVDLNQVLLDALELRRYALRGQQIKVITVLHPALPRVWADQFHLQQVFLNLLTNAEQALQAQPSDKRLVVGTQREGDRVIASVCDSGAGIPEAVLTRIFDPFYTTKPVGQGTGLGLSVADSIVRDHGGRISVRSRPGEGTTFCVELPTGRSDGDGEIPRSHGVEMNGTACAAPMGG